jgi:hypothetical protein
MNRTGFIPQEVVYICRKAERISPHWDDLDLPIAGDIEVSPAYVSAADNPKTIESGLSWAKQYQKVAPTQTAAANKPTSGWQIVGLDVRSEGGRAWKVRHPKGFYVDLREDVLLDALIGAGVKPGGYLNGKYLWAKIGSQMKLIREGSALHEAMEQAGDRRASKNLGAADFVPGHVYAKRNGERMLFLGRGQTWFYNDHKNTATREPVSMWVEIPEWADGKKMVHADRQWTRETPQQFINDLGNEKTSGSVIYFRAYKAWPTLVEDTGLVLKAPAGFLAGVRKYYGKMLAEEFSYLRSFGRTSRTPANLTYCVPPAHVGELGEDIPLATQVKQFMEGVPA